MFEARVSKRKYQQSGLKAGRPNGTQKLGHIIRPETVAKRAALAEALYIDQARAADIGIAPKYRNAIDPFHREVAQVKWESRAAQWDADHDVVKLPKPANKKSRKRNKTPRAAETYRAARRNAAPHPIRGAQGLLRGVKPTHSWPQPDFAKLAAKARHARNAALAA